MSGLPSELDDGINQNFDRNFFDGRLSDYLKREENSSPILSLLQNYDEELIVGGGKRFRVFLPVIMAKGLDLDLTGEQIHELFVAVEAVHGVSLVLDDVIDRDELRRGMKTTHRFMREHQLNEHQANSITSLDAFQMQSRAERIPLKFEFISQQKRIQISEIIGDSIERLCNGQVLDVVSENLLEHRDIVSEGESLNYLSFYNKILNNKTVPLFEAGPKILEIASGKDLQTLEKYSYHLAMAYQIRDDIIDIEGPGTDRSVAYEKDRFSDVREGKITLPVFYTLKFFEDGSSKEKILPSKNDLNERGRELIDILEADSLDQDAKQRVEQIIDSTNALEKSNKEVQSHLKQARESISSSDINNEQKKILTRIAEYAAKRKA